MTEILSIGVDTGGTFTDLVLMSSDGHMEVAKRPSTPSDFSEGIFDVIEQVGGSGVLREATHFCHGTTVATNAMITGTGAKVGFLTTAGHRDMLPMMRIIGRSAGKSETELKQYSRTDKPNAIVPKTLIEEVHERMAFRGKVVVPLNEPKLKTALERLLRDDVEAMAVCLLWAFMNPAHERRIRELIKELVPDMHVSLSSDIAPAIHEYERAATTVVNAHLAPVLESYLDRLEEGLKKRSLSAPLYIMQSVGGVMRTSDVEQRAANALGSGPAGGIVGAQFLGKNLQHENIICADVGGTSFDVGLVVNGSPVLKTTSDVNQYTLLVPAIDVVSIGAGGGSIARTELGRLQVGPQSAGADPGPACYGKGGEYPTVTDADVVLGYIDPNYFLGGQIPLDRDLAAEAIERYVAQPLGMSVMEAAAGIVEIANHHMSDLIRKMTIERGYDPRDFVLYAYGGAGPLHGAALAREIDASEVIVPLGSFASAFSALGLGTADLTAVARFSDPALAPFDVDAVNARFVELDQEATKKIGRSVGDAQIQRVLELQYRGQVHQVDAPVPLGTLTESDLEEVVAEFERRYERLYGRGSGFREAGIELQNYRVTAIAPIGIDTIVGTDGREPNVEVAPIESQDVYWWELRGSLPTDVYRDVPHDSTLRGPAIVRLATTTVLVPPGEQAVIDHYGNIRISISEKGR